MRKILGTVTIGQSPRVAQPGDEVLVTRMADGTPVRVAEQLIVPRLQTQIDRLAGRGAEIIALACTGEFPDFRCSKLLLRPQKVLYHVTASLAGGSSLGVLVPDPHQIRAAERRWREVASRVKVEAASAYGDTALIEESASRLGAWGANLLVMDCIGYTVGMKDRVKQLTGIPVILARSILARVIAELV